jgi:hypothetical protein
VLPTLRLVRPLKTLRTLQTIKRFPHDLGAYLRSAGSYQHFINPARVSAMRSIGWTGGTMLLLDAYLPDGRRTKARLYCKDFDILHKTRLILENGELLPVQLGFQISRSQWSLIPQI